MTLLEPLCSLELVDSLKYCLCTYTVSSVWVSKVTGKIDLVWLNLLEKLNDDVDVLLSALALLDTACLIERKVEEVAVCSIVKAE